MSFELKSEFRVKKKVSFELKSGLFKKKNPKTGLSNIYSQISLRSIEKRSTPRNHTHAHIWGFSVC